jgi:hypothetical protein
MGWSIGFDPNWKRDIGYGVPATCDHPGCGKEIDRGLSYVCGGDVYGGEHGCGLFFCGDHRWFAEEAVVCQQCRDGADEFTPTPDRPEWVAHKLTDESWAKWRAENPDWVLAARATGEYSPANSQPQEHRP